MLKKLIPLLVHCLPVFGQSFSQVTALPPGGYIRFVTADPSGACTNPGYETINTSTGAQNACINNVWTPLSGGGGGGVSSVQIAGTANQITASGTCTITVSGTCTLSIPSSPVFAGTVTTPTLLGTAIATPANPAAGKVKLYPKGSVWCALDDAGTETCMGSGGVTSLTGTANQVAVSAATGAITVSIPTNPTLPGTTTGTFVGNLTGTASVAASLSGAYIDWNASSGGTSILNKPTLTSGTVTSVATTGPITGGTITSTGTIACATCVTSAASLTSTAIMTGAGSQGSQTPAATATLDASGNISTPGSISTGVGGAAAGYIQVGQGTAPSLGTTAIQLAAPAGVTSYQFILPGAAGDGVLLNSNSTNTVTQSFVGTTGTSTFVRSNTPTLVTPVLGAATATSINGLTITSSTGTFTLTNGKTLTVLKTLTIDGTDGTTETLPSTSQTIPGMNQVNTGGTAVTWDLSASTASNAFRAPVKASIVTTANGSFGYDSTTNMLHAAQSSADAMIPQFTAAPANGDCAKWTVSGSNYKLDTAGSGCITLGTSTNGQVLINSSGAVAGVTRSGNGNIASASGALTNGHCVSIDGSGNFVDAGGACTTGGGGGTVNSATAGQFAYYATTGTAVSGNPNFTVSGGDFTLGVSGATVGTLAFANATSGTIKFSPTTGALGTTVLTLPATTGNIPSIAGSLAVTSGKTFSSLKTLTLDGTDSTTMTFPATSQTIPGMNSANTAGSSMTWDLSAASVTGGLKLPSAAAAAPTADGFIATDTTAHTLKYGANGSSKTVMATDTAVAFAQTPLTTKGDLGVTNGSAWNRLAVGSDGQVLTADAASTNGVKWAAAGGGITKLRFEGLSAATISGAATKFYPLLANGNATSEATAVVPIPVTGTLGDILLCTTAIIPASGNSLTVTIRTGTDWSQPAAGTMSDNLSTVINSSSTPVSGSAGAAGCYSISGTLSITANLPIDMKVVSTGGTTGNMSWSASITP